MFSLSGEILTARLRKLTFAAMVRQEVGWFDEERNSVGALCSKLSGDASAIQGVSEPIFFCSLPCHFLVMEIHYFRSNIK